MVHETAGPCLDLGGQPLLVVLLDLMPLGPELLVVDELREPLQLVCVCDPVVAAQGLCDQASKLWVAEG